jgi:hypothetical protein
MDKIPVLFISSYKHNGMSSIRQKDKFRVAAMLLQVTKISPKEKLLIFRRTLYARALASHTPKFVHLTMLILLL